MTNELKKNIARNMHYLEMNDKIDAQIKKLKGVNTSEAQLLIDNLQKRRDENYKHMQAPMSEDEYKEYDNNGEYIGQPKETSNSFKEKVFDGINHAAQGTSLGWSDEMTGVIGGVGRVVANTARRGLGYSVGGESIKDAWHKGYREYRDFARDVLNNGYKRNPVISAGSEIAGALASPIKPFKAKGIQGQAFGKVIAHPKDIAHTRRLNTLATGILNGTGYTHKDTSEEYVKNIGISTMTNVGGTEFGNKLFGSGNEMYQLGRGIMNGLTNSIPYLYDGYQGRKHGK